ncbi:thermonuclease family protein [Oscillatoria sp. FACHB-1406]|uniref:thermonuclease family protein n=1 Tax=Oscillatoria sp. FACHB-1406 TaxID=2692846 RepID=UPI00168714DF|nr:thermonuclease family protein [Oscillatoria sp. FACHB-1406]MBD2576841.1 thermonuclease family protein [Oscillatoria sp. FACHB-1406]
MVETRKLVLSLVGTCFLLLSSGCDSGQVVERVSDGDTLAVLEPGGQKITVRFACVDAPEVPHSAKERSSKRAVDVNQFKWGSRAQQRVEELLKTSDNRIVLTITDSDRYGRKVAEVRTKDGVFIQEVLTKEGLALAYRPYFKDCPSSAAIEQAETEAKSRRRGVWSDSKFTSPWEYRKFK